MELIIIIGMPLGYPVLYYLMTALAPEYELKALVNISTYIVSAVITFGVTFAVSLMVSAKNKKINMVEAPESSE